MNIIFLLNIDTHEHARGTLTEYKLRLIGFAGEPPLDSGDAFTHG